MYFTKRQQFTKVKVNKCFPKKIICIKNKLNILYLDTSRLFIHNRDVSKCKMFNLFLIHFLLLKKIKIKVNHLLTSTFVNCCLLVNLFTRNTSTGDIEIQLLIFFLCIFVVFAFYLFQLHDLNTIYMFFNKHDINIFINDTWQKYRGDIGQLFKITM